MSNTFKARFMGDYWSNVDNRWNIEIGKHRHKHLFINNAAIGMNLEEGYDNFENEHGNEKLEGILAYIMKTSRIGVPLKEQVQSDFVCRRGLLRNLSINKHCHTFITFFAVRHRGIIFLCEDKDFGEAPDKLRRAMYYNLKFENVMTVPQGKSITASKREETKMVIHAELTKEGANPLRVYYAAEVDCLGFNEEPIELKTISKPLETGWDKSRTLAWYMQCFFSNVKTIIVGERQRTRLREFRMVDVDSICQQNNHGWTLGECIGQLHDTLSFVKTHMPMDGMSFKFTSIHGTTYVAPTHYGDFIVPANFLRVFPF